MLRLLIRCDHFLAVANAVPGGGDRADLAGDLDRGIRRRFAVGAVPVLDHKNRATKPPSAARPSDRHPSDTASSAR